MTIRTPAIAFLALAALAVAGHAMSADQRQLSAGVADLRITRPTPAPGVKLENVAKVKTPAARLIRVTTTDPVFEVEGRLHCKPGSRPHSAQLFFGQAFLNNGQLVTSFTLAQSQKRTLAGGATAAEFSVKGTLPVTKTAGDSLVDLTFNPPRTFEQKLTSYVKTGGGAAEYLRQTESFSMPLSVSLVGWCSDANAKLFPAVVVRTLQVPVLYEGDHAVMDGLAPRAPTGVAAPPAPKPPRAKD